MSRRSGFTLIEAVVVAAVMGVLFVSGYVSFSGFSSRQDLDKARNKLVNQIKIARSYARANIIPEDQTVDDLRYVKLEIDVNGNAVTTSDIGETYSSVPIVGGNMTLSGTLIDCALCFSAGNGKLVTSSAEPIDPGSVVTVGLISKKDTDDVRSLEVDSSGLVKNL